MASEAAECDSRHSVAISNAITLGGGVNHREVTDVIHWLREVGEHRGVVA